MTIKLQSGFTLIELMLIVIIIGILAAVAIPNYQNYVKKSRISEATSALSDYRVKYEQYFMDNRTWPANSNACISATSSSPIPSSFNMSCQSDKSTYTITATGTGVMNGFTYTVDQSNTKTSNTSWGQSNTCWIRGSGGVC